MKLNRLLDNFWLRNLLGFVALLTGHLLTDAYAIGGRVGFSKISPYLYLLLLYGWLVFHNRVLFDGLFLKGKKVAYFSWLLLLVAASSFNMNFILHTQFGITQSLPNIVSFWVYAVAGFGVYISFRYLRSLNQPLVSGPSVSSENVVPEETGSFACIVDGNRLNIAYADIQYIEALENYLKVFTKAKTYITRLTLKEAEMRLPKRLFIRVSRSHIVNRAYVERVGQDELKIGEKELRIGKVYKRHVIEQFSGS